MLKEGQFLNGQQKIYLIQCSELFKTYRLLKVLFTYSTIFNNIYWSALAVFTLRQDTLRTLISKLFLITAKIYFLVI